MIPAAFLAQNEVVLETQEDLILALDRYILPSYPNFTTQNVGYTKTECYQLILSFMMAGKLHFRFKPEEVEKAVDAFLEDRLWVDRHTLETTQIIPSNRPAQWMARPSIFRVSTMIPKVLWDAFRVVLTLVKSCAIYHFYGLTKERTFTIPKSPNDKNTPKLVMIKKDS